MKIDTTAFTAAEKLPETAKSITIYDRNGHLVLLGAFEAVEHLPGKIDCFIFDTPGVEDDSTWFEYANWCERVFAKIELLRADDCALILLSRDRKGCKFLKSLVTSFVALDFGWISYRQIMWDKLVDYSRAKYMFQPIYIYRKGSKPTQMDSAVKFKDIIRLKDLSDTREGTVAELPIEIPKMLLSLFKIERACDPFAGSGSTAMACAELGIPCVSCELDPDRAKAVVDRIDDFYASSKEEKS